MAASIQGVSSIGGMAQLQAAKPLTAEQKKTVQDILSNYDAKNIGATGCVGCRWDRASSSGPVRNHI